MTVSPSAAAGPQGQPAVPPGVSPAAEDAERLREIILDLDRSRAREADLRREADALIDGMQALVGSDDLDAAFRALLAVFRDVLDFDDAFVLDAHDGAGAPDRLTVSIATLEEYAGLTASLSGPLARAHGGQTVILAEAAALRRALGLPEAAAARVASAVLTPLSGWNRRAVLVCVKGERAFFGKRHRRLLDRLTPLARQAMMLLEQRERYLDGLKRIGALLDAAPHNIISIERDLRIGKMLSRTATALFHRTADEIRGAAADALLTETFALEADAAARLRDTLDVVMGADSLTWSLNAGHLPGELTSLETPARVFELLWTPMMDACGAAIDSVLLSIRDITDERDLAAQIEQRERAHAETLQALDQLIRAPRRRLAPFFEDARGKRRLVSAALSSHGAPAGFDRSVKGAVHALKGDARLLGFEGLSGALHEIEETARRLADAPDGAAESAAPPELFCEWEKVEARFSALEETYRSYFAEAGDAPTSQSPIAVCEPILADARRAVEAAGGALSIAFTDGYGPMSPALAAGVGVALTQLVSNMVDHSILPRLAAEGRAAASLAVAAASVDGALEIVLTDDGFGFDTEAIAARARAKGLAADPTSALELVFEPGFSTASAVTQRSGRGVGMAAARDALRALGGDIALRDTGRSGTYARLWAPTPQSDTVRP